MQPVNCFWVGLGVCFSYHSEKEKESFIVEEKKKTATLALIVGGVFSLRALLRLNNVFAKFSVLEVAKIMGRSRETVSRYVHEREAAVNAVRVVIEAQNT